MKIAIIILSVFIGITLLIVGTRVVIALENIAENLSLPITSTTTIEYLKIQPPDSDTYIEIHNLHSEVDSKIIMLILSQID